MQISEFFLIIICLLLLLLGVGAGEEHFKECNRDWGNVKMPRHRLLTLVEWLSLNIHFHYGVWVILYSPEKAIVAILFLEVQPWSCQNATPLHAKKCILFLFFCCVFGLFCLFLEYN
jgi:hypothetical protein